MFRYSFVDGKTECIERLPEEWRDDKCMWLVPQPTIAPIKVIYILLNDFFSLINPFTYIIITAS